MQLCNRVILTLWTETTVSPLEGSLSLIQLFRWLGKWSKKRVIMRFASLGSFSNKTWELFPWII